MFDTTPNGLLSLIEKGESELVEFKAFLPRDKVVARDLNAFANTEGGILIIGVDDNGEILGLPNAEVERTITRLKNVSSSLCDWTVDIGAADINNKQVVYLTIGKAPAHLTPVMTSSGEIFARRGSTDISLSQDQKLDLVREQRRTIKDRFMPHPTDRPCEVLVAMSFREEQEPALVDYYRAMQRAVSTTGLPININRMDLMEGDYEISQEIMSKIKEADVIVTDFTLSSPNVYFELGYARGCGKRIIQTARKDTVLEFDARNWRTLIYRNATELEEKLVLEIRVAHAEFTDQLMKPNAT